MNAEEPRPDDAESILTWLVACDKALAEGTPPQQPPNADSKTTVEWQPRLQGALACIQMLRQVLPRRAAPPFVPTQGGGHEGAGPAADLPFQQLGRFQLRRLLGQGAFGMVFLAADPQLGRDVALKVPRPEALLTGELRERFVREARAAAGLDHPNLVPVYEASAVGPLCYIASAYCPGITLTEWLRDRSEAVPLRQAAELTATLAEAVQHAHERGVVHRDLKPSNVLLQRRPRERTADADSAASGPDAAFDFVPRITDFGLAKLTAETPPPPGEEGARTQSGAVLGTPSYMAPEQASGKNKEIGPAADIYALGVILYELLTGRPPFRGETILDTLEQVRTREPLPPGRLRPKLARDLETICLKCLHKEPAKRYASAQALADDLRRFLQGRPIVARPVSRPEKVWRWCRRNPRDAVLAGLVLVLVVGGVAGLWWRQRQQEQADQAVINGLAQAELLEQQAREVPLEPGKYHQALAAARMATQLAEGASAHLRRRAEEVIARLEQEETAAQRDRRLLAALLEVRGPREGPKYSRDDKGLLTALAEPTADEQFAAAFRSWGLDVDAMLTAEAVARLKERPAAVVMEVVAALDEWASERRRQGKPRAEWQRLAELAAALDDDPGSQRRELRALVARGQLPVERALGVLSAALRPVPVPVQVPLGRDHARLQQLAEQVDPATESVLGLLTLTRALRVAGEEALAERLLREAVQARPREVVLYYTLGQMLTGQEPPRWVEAVACYAAARALRPDLGVRLSTALLRSGHEREGLTLLKRLVKETPDNPFLHFAQGYALYRKHDLDGAIACYKTTLALDPKDADAHNNLGVALYHKQDLDSAIACFKTALALNPKYADAHKNLGAALHYKDRLDDAIERYRQAIDLDPKNATAHYNLGVALADKGQLGEATEEYRRAIELAPKFVPAHTNLGNALWHKGQLDEAIVECRRAIELNPKDAKAHYNLGVACRDKGQLDDAIVEYRRAIDLDPKDAKAHTNLGNALYDQGRLDEAMAEYHKAIALGPELAQTHGALGEALLKQGRFTEAQVAIRHCLDLLPPNHPLRQGVTQQLRLCEQLLQLDAKLPAILKGEAKPADTAERLTLAQLCQQCKRLYAASARFYTEAFAADPRLAADLRQQHRYNAACAAALAGCGQGKDADKLDTKERAHLRQQALDWLRADLKAYRQTMEKSADKAGPTIAQRMQHWLQDTDFAGLREPTALAKLPEGEQQAWRQLWTDVADLLKKAAPEK